MPPNSETMLRALHQAGGDMPEMETSPQGFEPNALLSALEQHRSDEEIVNDESGSGSEPTGSGEAMNKVEAKTGWRRTALPLGKA